MKILWLFPPSMREGEFPLVSQNRWFKYIPEQTNNIYPILASYGMSMLKEAGHEIKFVDAPTMGVDSQWVIKGIPDYDIVVMECRTAIANHILKWAQAIKGVSPSTKVILYGDHAMVLKGRILATNNCVDYIINCGDYDWGVHRTILDIATGSPMMYHKAIERSLMTKEQLDILPFVDRELVPWQDYFEAWRHREEFGWVQSQRGCKDHCTFCAWNHIFWGNGIVRSMSPNRVANEYIHMKEKYGIREVLDDADTFYEYWGLVFAHELLERDLDMFWNVQTRADEIKDWKSWHRMNKAGLHVVKLGADGGSDLTLQKIVKGHTIQHTRDAVKALKKAGCEIHINMVLGYPWEDKKMSYDVIKFVKSLKPNQAQFSIIQPFPGTPLYSQAIKEGWLAVDEGDWDRWNMKEPILQGEMTADEIRELHKRAWSSFYLTPSFIMNQGWKSFKLVLKERSLEPIRHVYRGYKGVRQNMKAME